MDPEKLVISVSINDWRTHGGRMMRWINDHLGEDCYRLKFRGHSVPVDIVFDEPTQAVAFNLCVLFAGLEVLE